MLFKRIFFIIIIGLLFGSQVIAQVLAGGSPYVLPAFVKGTVLQKGGAMVQATLNYNTITQEMMFESEGKNLVLDQADNIDTIYLGSRKFIPARQVYFEKLTNTSVPLYVQYKSRAVPTQSDKPGGESNAIGGMNGSQKKEQVQKLISYELKLPDNYQLKTDNEYWVQNGAAFVPVSNIKKMAKLFPGKEEKINAYIKENNINFGQQEDVIKLIIFCNGL